MDPIEVIEKRISALEEKIHGKNKSTSIATPLASDLVDANAKLVSALTQRDSINSVLGRLDQLEEFMDPLYMNKSGLSTETKMELVNSSEDEIKEMLVQLEEVNKLTSCLDSEHIKKVPDLNSELEKLTLDYLDFKDKTDQKTSDVQALMKKYNEIANLISASFVKWDEIITEYEIQAAPKKIID